MLTFKTYQNLYNDTISLLLSKVPKDVDVVVEWQHQLEQ
jgi:hypothetical protein